MATEYVLQSARAIVRALELLFTYSEEVTPQEFDGFAFELLARNPHVKSALAAGPDGTLYQCLLEEEALDPGYSEALRKKLIEVAPPDEEPLMLSLEVGGRHTIVMVAAVNDPQVSVVAVEIDPLTLESILEIELGLPRGYIQLVDERGTVFSNPAVPGETPVRWTETTLGPMAPGWRLRAGYPGQTRPLDPSGIQVLAGVCLAAGTLLWLAARSLVRKEKTLQDVHEQVETLRQIFDTSPDLIVYCDPEGTIQKTNRTLRNLLGASEPQLSGSSAIDLFCPGDARDVEQTIARTLNGDAPAPLDCYLNGGLAGMVPVRLNVIPIAHGRTVRGLMLHMTDLRWKKDEEELTHAYIQKLEQEVKKRTHELEEKNRLLEEKLKVMEEFHDAAVGRELRIIDLKKRVKQLEAQLANRGET